jgi:hypothetical protein
MGKVNRWDVVRKIDELAPATKEGVASSLDSQASKEQVEGAFEGAVRHGLIEKEAAPADEGSPQWTLSEKGRRKLADKA